MLSFKNKLGIHVQMLDEVTYLEIQNNMQPVKYLNDSYVLIVTEYFKCSNIYKYFKNLKTWEKKSGLIALIRHHLAVRVTIIAQLSVCEIKDFTV